eukprot:g5368.t1
MHTVVSCRQCPGDATISVWHVTESRGHFKLDCVTVLSGHENEVKCAAFSSSDKFFASCSRVILRLTASQIWVYDAEDTDEYECVALLHSFLQDVKSVRWHPEQDVLFSCSYDDTIKVWGPDGDDWCCKETLPGHDSTVWSMSFDSTGSHFVSCSDDRTLRLWAPSQTLPADFSPVENLGNNAVQGPPPHPARSSNKFSAFELIKATSLRPLFRGEVETSCLPSRTLLQSPTATPRSSHSLCGPRKGPRQRTPVAAGHVSASSETTIHAPCTAQTGRNKTSWPLPAEMIGSASSEQRRV